MADFGHIVLVVGLVAAIYSAVATWAGATLGHRMLAASARSFLFVTFGMVTMATVGLLVALIGHDFEFGYVASYTSRDMSLPYLISALWAGNAGSLLLWTWLLTVFAVLMVTWKHKSIEKLLPYAMPFVMVTTAFFLVLVVFVASPFDKLSFVPRDGTGLNPLLQNPGMIFHPPTLIAGFAGLTIPFAIAMSALLNRTAGRNWLDGLRRWIVVAWILLTVGNVLGAWWAYVELGWGGYWGWDPVENSSLIPWLVATGLLHAVVLQRSRGRYKLWTFGLTVAAFVLPIVATFFTRTGVLSSVHAFPDTGMGPLFVAFIALSLIGPAILLYINRDLLDSDREPGPLASREGALQATNIVFLLASVIVLLGTMFPLFSKIIGGEQSNLQQDFFNLTAGPFFVMAILLIGVCTATGWRQTTPAEWLRSAALPLAVGWILGLFVAIATSAPTWAAFALALSAFAMCGVLVEIYQRVMARSRTQGENPLAAFARTLGPNRRQYAVAIVHLGIILMAFGIVASSAMQMGTQVSLARGEAMNIGQYTITYVDLQARDHTPLVQAVSATLAISRSGKDAGVMISEKYFHENFTDQYGDVQPVTEVAIRSGWREDLYVILAGWDGSGATAAFEIFVNPGIMWIWIGGGFLTFGGIIALWDRRRPAVILSAAEGDPALDDEIEKEVMQLRQAGAGHGENTCSSCGARCPEGGLFCPQCGAKGGNTCSECGAQYPEGGLFCPQCGLKVG